MSESQVRELNEFKDDLIKKIMVKIVAALAIAAISIVFTSVGFYYNTKNSLNNLQERHETMRNRQFYFEQVLQQKVDRVEYIREVDEVKQLLRDINRKIDNIK